MHIREISPPQGEEAIEWYLLTSLPVWSVNDAEQVLEYYLKRWRIEDFFRVLKSGCKVESCAHRSALRLQRMLAIHLVIAWRLMVLTLLGRTLLGRTLLGRTMPDLDPEVFFTEMELAFLTEFARMLGLSECKTLGACTLLLAILGGYQRRGRDPPPPGHQTMWTGLQPTCHSAVGLQGGPCTRLLLRKVLTRETG